MYKHRTFSFQFILIFYSKCIQTEWKHYYVSQRNILQRYGYNRFYHKNEKTKWLAFTTSNSQQTHTHKINKCIAIHRWNWSVWACKWWVRNIQHFSMKCQIIDIPSIWVPFTCLHSKDISVPPFWFCEIFSNTNKTAFDAYRDVTVVDIVMSVELLPCKWDLCALSPNCTWQTSHFQCYCLWVEKWQSK